MSSALFVHPVDSGSRDADKVRVVLAWHLTQVTAPQYLASGAETITIRYQLNNPSNVELTFRLTIAQRDTTLVVDRALTVLEAQQTSIDWTGATGGGWANVQNAPYTVKIVATDGAKREEQTAVVSVEVQSTTLTLADPAVLQIARHQAVVRELAALPARGNTSKVYLTSNVFSVGMGDKAYNNATSFERYRNLWSDDGNNRGEGPAIPIVATVKVRANSDVNGLASSRALGTGRIVWDYADAGDPARGLTERPTSFILDASDYSKTSTTPPGLNCHVDRGGKRGAAAGPAEVLPASADWGAVVTGAFAFTAVHGAVRTWGLLGTIVSSPGQATDAQSGIVFRPSRIAGDAYRITAWFDAAQTLDAAGAPVVTAECTGATGTFEVWRSVNFAKVYVKGGLDSFTLATVQGIYDTARVRLVWNSVVTDFGRSDYNTHFSAAIDAVDIAGNDGMALMKKYAVIAKDGQFDGGSKAAVRLLSREDFEAAYYNGEVRDKMAAKMKEAPQDVLQARGQREWARRELERVANRELSAVYEGKRQAPSDTTDEIYMRLADEWACDVINEACKLFITNEQGNPDGIFVFGFEWAASCMDAGTAKTLGFVVQRGTGVPAPTAAGYIQLAPSAYYAGGAYSLNNTVTHEAGHLLFLPHPKQVEAAADAKAHDDADDACIMSYHHTVPKHFCGYCLLRLRGWDHTRLAAGTTGNQRPNAKRPELTVTVPAALDGARTGAVTLTNSAAAEPLVITAITAVDGDLTLTNVPGLPLTLAAAATGTFNVTMPASATIITRHVRIVSNADPLRRVVAVRSDSQPARLTAAVAKVKFDDTYVNETRSIDVVLTAQRRCVIAGTTVTGIDVSQFTITAAIAADTVITTGTTKTVTIRFNPDADGPKLAALRIVSDAPDSPLILPIEGVCFADIRYTVIGNRAFRTGSTERRVFTIRSTGTLPLNVLKIRKCNMIESATITLANLPPKTTLAQNETVDFTVVYTAPAKITQYERQRLFIDTNAPGSDSIEVTS